MTTLMLREAQPEDMNFVHASWFESYWKGRVRDEGVAFEDFKRGHNLRAAALLERSTALCAFFPAVPEEILGYVVREASVAHYAYVKSDFRRQHIAKKLLAGVERYTHQTRAGERVARALGLQFDPYRMEFP